MKHSFKTLVIALSLMGSVAAQAEEAYIGGVAGLVDINVSGDNPLNGGVRVGYIWNSGFGIEAELTDSLVEGEQSPRPYGDRFDYSFETQALYVTYRTQGDVYFKGRLGYSHEEMDVKYLGGPSESGVSAGVGAGFKLAKNVDFEAEYTFLDSDVDYWSGSLIYRF
ncbi:porin family protein [Microbulbifer variabilis]|uniref:porin family protein n=1 Tax=Microbulbifer variabilis TaxID=266805 RepID=UPI001CFDFE22|nr:porin family protein [Microbulbifer variabilis]